MFAARPAHRCSLNAALPFSFSSAHLSMSMYSACCRSFSAFSVSCSRFSVSAFLACWGKGVGWEGGVALLVGHLVAEPTC